MKDVAGLLNGQNNVGFGIKRHKNASRQLQSFPLVVAFTLLDYYMLLKLIGN